MAAVTAQIRHFVLEKTPRNLLLDWVNLGDAQLLKRNPGLRAIADVPNTGKPLEEIRGSLRRAWLAEDRRDREFFLFTARYQYEQAHLVVEWGKAGKHFIPAPSNDAFHQAIFNLLDSGAVHKLSKCALKECHTPFFIRRRPKRQPYCSTVCHAEALREIKRRWHRENRGKAAQHPTN